MEKRCENHNQRISSLEKDNGRFWTEMSKMEGRINQNRAYELGKLELKVEDYTKNNDENMAEIKEDIGTLKNDVSGLKTDMSQVKTDVGWLKHNHWIVVGASVSAAIGAVISIILTLLQDKIR